MSTRHSAGYCLIGTGVFLVVGFLIHPPDYSADNRLQWWAGHSLIFVGLFLNLVALIWIYATDGPSLGKAGKTGLLLACFGLSLYIGKLYWSGLLYPYVLEDASSLVESLGIGPGNVPQTIPIKVVFNGGALLFSAGHLLFGATMLRSGGFQSIPIGLLMTGAVLVGLWPLMPGALQMLSPIASAIYAVGVVWLGWTLGQKRPHPEK